jgi:hypothetical protein
MEPEGSLPCSQEPATDLCPEPDESSPHPSTLLLLEPFRYYEVHYYSESELCVGAVTVSFFKVPPLASKRCTSYNAPPTSRSRAADRWSFEISCLEAPFSWLEKPRNRMGRDLDRMADVLMAFHRSAFSKPNTELNSDLAAYDIFWAFPTMKSGAPRQEISKWSTVCSMFLRSGWGVVRSASLATGGTSKKRPSPHLHTVPTRNNVSPRTFQTDVVLGSHFGFRITKL